MKSHPRIRKTVKWVGAAVTVLLLATWLISGWHEAPEIGRDDWSDKGGLSAGAVFVGNWSQKLRKGEAYYPFYEDTPRLKWWFVLSESNSLQRIAMPLWVPAVASLLITATAWRLDTLARRRARQNLCPKCSYDRAGLAIDAKCPECGTLKA